LDQQVKLTPRNTDLMKEKAAISPKPILSIPPSPTIIEPEPKVGEEAPKAPEIAPAPLKVAILGTAPSSRDKAPYNDPSWQIWSCSPGNMGVPRVDVWFEIHNNLLLPENISYGGPYIEWLKQQKFPIYMQDNSLVPNAIALPKDELVGMFGKYFFTSSFAWMMAMAMKMGASEIALFGVDMASKNEYILQRPGGHYFMQLAATRGIRVTVPFESDLAQHPGLYGYDQNTPFGRKMLVREQEIQARVAAMKGDRDKLNQSITYLEGALEDLDYVKSIWGGLQT
jgi:hypothetical protein